MESIIKNCKHCNKVATHVVDDKGEATCTQCGTREGSGSQPPLEERAELEISPGISKQATVNPTASPTSFSLEELNKKIDGQFRITREVADELVASLKGYDIEIIGSIKTKGGSDKDIDILLKLPEYPESEGVYQRFEEDLKKLGWLYSHSSENNDEDWGIFHHYRKDDIGLDVFVDEKLSEVKNVDKQFNEEMYSVASYYDTKGAQELAHSSKEGNINALIRQQLSNKKLQEVIKKIGSQFQVQSHKGRNLGTYKSKKAAGKRLGQVEWFKAHPKDEGLDYEYDYEDATGERGGHEGLPHIDTLYAGNSKASFDIKGNTLWIYGLAAKPKGKGIGSAMLDQLILDNPNVVKMKFGPDDGAVGFYEKYAEARKFHHWYDGDRMEIYRLDGKPLATGLLREGIFSDRTGIEQFDAHFDTQTKVGKQTKKEYYETEKGYKGQVVNMSPDQYIELAGKGMWDKMRPKEKTQWKDYNAYKKWLTTSGKGGRLIDDKLIAIRNKISAGTKLGIPWIEYYKDGSEANQEGYHRAMVAKEMGIASIPVMLINKPSKLTEAVEKWDRHFREI